MGAEERVKQQQLAEARQAFARAVSEGQANALPHDRFGAVVKAGDMVLYRPDMDVVYKVTDIRPVLDPRLPPGFVTLVLEANVPLNVPVNRGPIRNLLVIGVQQPDEPPADKKESSLRLVDNLNATEPGPEDAPAAPAGD